jgi:hypothetical protein
MVRTFVLQDETGYCLALYQSRLRRRFMSPAAPSPFAARTLALHAQGLAAPDDPSSPATPERILAAVERIGCVQNRHPANGAAQPVPDRMETRGELRSGRLRWPDVQPSPMAPARAACSSTGSTPRVSSPWPTSATRLPSCTITAGPTSSTEQALLAENGNAHLLDEVRDRIARQGPQRARTSSTMASVGEAGGTGSPPSAPWKSSTISAS